MNRKVNFTKAESMLTAHYVNKFCSFTYPGYDEVCGKVDEIAIDITGTEPMVVIQMNDKRYTCSPESIADCLQLLNSTK